MQKPSSVDHYRVLGIPQSATLPQIRQAYRKLALKCHPDKKAPGQTVDAEKFRRVQEAWEVLRDESKRVEYDRSYAEIHREWEDYCRWCGAGEYLLEQLRRIKEELRRRKARERAIERALRQAGSWMDSFEAARREFEAAKQRLHQERIEGEEVAAVLYKCLLVMENDDSWREEVEMMLKKIQEDVAELSERKKASRAENQ
ncbi:DnaJ-domain-containing protein [Colletotrichum zoysiae]|uniref:DnaJ-domain-containing protein n=1 Tax=Colletotrichum zoysiae TaxID=1216348 RepID=A0AAD9HPM3_9PEZI|nr:DnaJ-domain-containing protein [Colletotrichum zoysiae]